MIHLVTGGSGSGKSAFAEQQILDMGPAHRLYIATMHPYDEESFQRIERHRRMRAEKNFDTLERYTDLLEAEIPDRCNVLLECMSNLVSNEMFEPTGAGELAVDAIMAGIRHIADCAENLVIVTNEIFSDGIDYPDLTKRYQINLAEINCYLAQMADLVTEVVYGIPVAVKRRDGGVS